MWVQMMLNYKYLILFVVTASVAILSQLIVVAVRFGQPTTIENYNFLTYGYLILLVLTVVCWLFFPSRVLIFCIGLTGVFFPSLFKGEVNMPFYANTSKLELLKISLIFIIPTLLLVLATEFRRRIIV
jgi:hypothetical protein